MIASIYANAIYSQDVTIKGTVIDEVTAKPVAYAHIYFDYNLGSSTNREGKFILNYDENMINNDSLTISCIGYKPKKISLSEIDKYNDNRISIIPLIYKFDAITIKSQEITPYELLQSALHKLKTNCLNKSTFYHCAYYEHIDLFQEIPDTTTRTVKSNILLETQKYNKIRKNIGLSIDEKIYFISIDRGKERLFADHIKEPSELKYLLAENLLNYRRNIFYSKKKYNYEIEQIYYDSTLLNSIIEIAITPKDTNKHFGYANVFIASNKHQIIRVQERYLKSRVPDGSNGKYGVYRYADSESLIVYKINSDGKMELSYIHSFFGNSFYEPEINKTTYVKNVFIKLNVIGKVKNGYKLKNELPEMQYDKNAYNQEYNDNKSFKLEPGIEYAK